MKVSELMWELQECLDLYGDVDVMTQANYEMGLCDNQYDLMVADPCENCNTGNITFVIGFDGFQVLRDSGLNPITLEKMDKK
jgi:hypothetical protein